MNHPNALIIFAKNLVYGGAKTRLAATIGVVEALNIYKELIDHTRSATANLPCSKIVYFDESPTINDEWNGHYETAIQQGDDLGRRMCNAFRDVFANGCSKAVIIGTDCPSLNEAIIQDAFKKLDDVDVVIGPAFDGGYYLLGMKQVHAHLFEHMKWSTDNVLPETIERCKTNHHSYLLLEQLHDIDEEKDLIHLQKAKA